MFIKIMEAGIAFPMILAILFAYYQTNDIVKKRKVLTSSVVVGFILAFIIVYIRNIPNFINRTTLSFQMMIPVVIGFAFLLVLIFLDEKIKKRSHLLYEHLITSALVLYTIASCTYYLPLLFVQINGFVYYGESAVSTTVLFRVIGFVFALLMMLLSVWVIYQTSIKLYVGQLKFAIILALFIRSIAQINVIISRLYSLKIIPKNTTLFSGIAFITNNSIYFDFVFMIILIIVPIILWKQNIKITQEYRNTAELRKIKYTMMKKRHIAQFFIVLMVLNIVSLSALKTYAYREIPLSDPEDYTIVDGYIEIPLSTLEDGVLHRYAYQTTDDKEVRFIIIKKAQGSYGVGLDACEICGPSGYFMRDDEVICKLCDVVMNKGTIGFSGGCNPIPFAYIVHDQKIKIDPATLDSYSYVFK